MLDYIANSQPNLDHCLGISYDVENLEITVDEFNPQRPEMGENPFEDIITDEEWYKLNEQNDEVLEAAREAYFKVFDKIFRYQQKKTS